MDVPVRAKGTGVTGLLMIIIGLVLAAAGMWLAALGGSWYYVGAGLGFAATGVLLWRRSASALWVYAIFFIATLLWSVWEVGIDWWPLAARLDVPFMVGALLLTPWITRPLSQAATRMPSAEPGSRRVRRNGASPRRGGGLLLSLGLLAFAGVAVWSWMHDPHTVKGALPPARAAAAGGDSVPPGEWQAYGRTGMGQRYSPLTQITPANAGQLQLAWEFRTGDVRGRPGDPEETTFEVTPLKIGNRLFLCTPHQSVIALDATTGAQVWRRDLQVAQGLALQHLTCRGLSYQPPAEGVAGAGPGGCAAKLFMPTAEGVAGTGAGGCASKLFMPTADGRVVALNPENGESCTAFGNGQGQIDLWANMPNHRPGAYYSTSPVVVTKKLLIVGGTVLDNVSTHEQSGVIRAFDIETGALVWNWDSGNPEATAPIAAGQTYTPNSPNSWSISSVDEALGLVYVPMGNQTPDVWGGKRSEAAERYSSSVVALELASGRVRWVYQTVHHDLWDYDVPSQPSLVDLRIGGQTVPALVQPTKQGELFVLDRRTGTPLHPVTEEPVPGGAANGDRTAPTQPKTQLSFDPPKLSGSDMWGATMFDQLYCRIAFQRLRYDGRFTPPSTQGSLIYPGNFGVFNWGSVAVDPVRQVAFTTPAYLAFVSQLVPRPDDTSLMVQGKERPKDALPSLNENFGAPYAVKLSAFTSPLGIPCHAPPWGYVAGVDLASGEIAWKHRNGTVRDLAPVPLPFRMGVPNLGGPIVTAAGVAFLSGTLDYYVRAYDVSDGRELWRSRLPAGGQATPMTYTGADGRQYLLVAAGGHGSTGTKAGDYVLAYALPKS